MPRFWPSRVCLVLITAQRITVEWITSMNRIALTAMISISVVPLAGQAYRAPRAPRRQARPERNLAGAE